MKARELRLALLIAALLTAVVFSPSGGDWLWSRRLHDFAHAPIFGSISLFSLLLLRSRSRLRVSSQYLSAFLAALTLGGLSELAQALTRRDPSWGDLGMDALGTVTFLSIYAAFDTRLSGNRQRWAMSFAVLSAALVLFSLGGTAWDYISRARAFPVIVDFSRDIGADFWTTRQVRARVEALPERFSQLDERALRVEFLPGRWQGLDLREPPRDWRGYDSLMLDVVNPTQDELKIVLRIDDLGYNGPDIDRYNGRFELPAFTRASIRIPLSEIESAPKGRRFNLSNITRILLFRRHDSPAREMYVVGLRLVDERQTRAAH
jgi:hypothetical protein